MLPLFALLAAAAPAAALRGLDPEKASFYTDTTSFSCLDGNGSGYVDRAAIAAIAGRFPHQNTSLARCVVDFGRFSTVWGEDDVADVTGVVDYPLGRRGRAGRLREGARARGTAL